MMLLWFSDVGDCSWIFVSLFGVLESRAVNVVSQREAMSGGLLCNFIFEYFVIIKMF